jgi:uncharacterized integral membrane protein
MRHEDDRGDEDRERDPQERGQGLDHEGDGWRRRREGPSAKLVALGVLGVLLLVFVLQNLDEASVDVLFWDAEIPLWVPILLSAVLGLVAGLILGRLSARRRGSGRS